MTLINGAPWVSVDLGSADAGYLGRIDPATNLVDRVLVPGGGAFGGGGDIVVSRRGRVGYRWLQQQAAPAPDVGVHAVTDVRGRSRSMAPRTRMSVAPAATNAIPPSQPPRTSDG